MTSNGPRWQTRNRPVWQHAPALVDRARAQGLGILEQRLRDVYFLVGADGGEIREDGTREGVDSPPRYAGPVYFPLAILDDVGNLWLQEPLGADWMVAYRLSLDRGAPIVSEVRVFPRESGNPVGEWSAAILGSRAHVPSGGLTTKLVRCVRTGAPSRFAAQIFEALARTPPEAPDAQVGPRVTRRGRRSSRPVAWYAELAETYVQAVRRGDRAPARTVADRYLLSRAQARVELHRARKRGLLTEVWKSGVRGGALTPLARRMLARARQGRPVAVPMKAERKRKKGSTRARGKKPRRRQKHQRRAR